MANNHRTRKLRQIDYRELKKLYTEFKTNPDHPRLRSMAYTRIRAILHEDDIRNTKHHLNIALTPLYTLDYFFTISSEPGIELLLPPTYTPGWSCNIRPFYFPTFFKDRYAIPNCNLKNRYIRFAETDSFNCFLAFIKRERDIDHEKEENPASFLPLGRQGPPPLKYDHRIAIIIFLATVLVKYQWDGLIINDECYPPSPGNKNPWSMAQLKQYTNFVCVYSTEYLKQKK